MKFDFLPFSVSSLEISSQFPALGPPDAFPVAVRLGAMDAFPVAVRAAPPGVFPVAVRAGVFPVASSVSMLRFFFLDEAIMAFTTRSVRSLLLTTLAQLLVTDAAFSFWSRRGASAFSSTTQSEGASEGGSGSVSFVPKKVS